MLVKSSPYLAVDDSIARAIQSVDLGPIAVLFPAFRWAGGSGAAFTEGAAVLLVLVFNRRAWLLAAASLAGGGWYPLIVRFASRPRPAPGQVLHITEHPGASSFPSGHVIFITIALGIAMLCVGHRYLHGWMRIVAWVIAGAVVLLVAISRVYVGAHWPFDVLASMLIAGGWLSLVASIRWLSDRAFDEKAD